MKQMVLAAIILIFLLGNFYVFHHLWVAMPPNLIGRISIIAFAVILFFSLFIYFLAGETMPISASSFFYKIGTSWLFILIYFVIIFLVKDLIGLSNKLFHFMPSDALTRYTKDNWIGLTFMVGFITMLMVCGYLKYQWKVRVDIPIQTSKNLGARDSLTIVAISDLHLGYGISSIELDSWIKTINKEKPDLIIIGGDIIDSSVRPLNAGDYAETLRKLNAPLGIFTCMGNHEYLSGATQSADFIEKTGIQLLRDSYTEIDSCIYIIGRDDRSNPKRKTLSELTSDLDKSKLTILLDHQPYNLEEAEQNGMDIQFSGHTHQGQVWPISMITKAIYEIDHGYLKKGNSNIIVSSGIGIWGGKFRIGTQSEYIVIKLKKV